MIVIYGELRSLKNSKQIRRVRKKGGGTRPIISASDAYKSSETHFIAQCMQARRDFLRSIADKDYPERPLRISFKFYRQTAGKFDYINIAQGLLDCMVKAGLIPDDNANEVIPVFEKYEIDASSPRTEVKVL